jgi:hypothetical protein
MDVFNEKDQVQVMTANSFFGGAGTNNLKIGHFKFKSVFLDKQQIQK